MPGPLGAGLGQPGCSGAVGEAWPRGRLGGGAAAGRSLPAPPTPARARRWEKMTKLCILGAYRHVHSARIPLQREGHHFVVYTVSLNNITITL